MFAVSYKQNFKGVVNISTMETAIDDVNARSKSGSVSNTVYNSQKNGFSLADFDIAPLSANVDYSISPSGRFFCKNTSVSNKFNLKAKLYSLWSIVGSFVFTNPQTDGSCSFVITDGETPIAFTFQESDQILSLKLETSINSTDPLNSDHYVIRNWRRKIVNFKISSNEQGISAEFSVSNGHVLSVFLHQKAVAAAKTIGFGCANKLLPPLGVSQLQMVSQLGVNLISLVVTKPVDKVECVLIGDYRLHSHAAGNSLHRQMCDAFGSAAVYAVNRLTFDDAKNILNEHVIPRSPRLVILHVGDQNLAVLGDSWSGAWAKYNELIAIVKNKRITLLHMPIINHLPSGQNHVVYFNQLYNELLKAYPLETLKPDVATLSDRLNDTIFLSQDGVDKVAKLIMDTNSRLPYTAKLQASPIYSSVPMRPMIDTQVLTIQDATVRSLHSVIDTSSVSATTEVTILLPVLLPHMHSKKNLFITVTRDSQPTGFNGHPVKLTCSVVGNIRFNNTVNDTSVAELSIPLAKTITLQCIGLAYYLIV
jgi:hypothetical protein